MPVTAFRRDVRVRAGGVPAIDSPEIGLSSSRWCGLRRGWGAAYRKAASGAYVRRMVRCESDGSKISAFAGGVHSWGPATPGTQRSTDTRYGLPTYGPGMSFLRHRVWATFIPLGRTRGAQAPMETAALRH